MKKFCLAMLIAALPACVSAAELPKTDWEGYHVGLQTGYTHGDFKDEVYGGFYGNAVSGGLLGVQAGYDYRFNGSLILGLEGDASLNSASGDNPNWTVEYKKENEISARARMGIDMGNYMPYLTAGRSWATLSETDHNASLWKSGWTAGAGIEAVVTDRLTARVEYRYADYGNTADNDAGDWYILHVTDQTLRAAINYNFR